MSRIPINPERYQVFIDAFLTLGPHFGPVARRVGCDPITAKKAWSRGWPEVSYAPPISRIYAEAAKRRELAVPGRVSTQRAVAAEAPRQEVPGSVEKVRENTKDTISQLQKAAIDALESEVSTLQALRERIKRTVLASTRVLDGLEALAGAAAENMAIKAQNVAAVSPDSVLGPMERFARVIDSLSTSTKKVMEMQRLLVGAPQQITESRGAAAPDAADTAERLQRIARLMDLMRRNGLIPAPDAAAPTTPDSGAYQGEQTAETGTSAETSIEVIPPPR